MKLRFVVRGCNDTGSVKSRPNQRSWDVFDTVAQITVANHPTRLFARDDARERNQAVKTSLPAETLLAESEDA